MKDSSKYQKTRWSRSAINKPVKNSQDAKLTITPQLVRLAKATLAHYAPQPSVAAGIFSAAAKGASPLAVQSYQLASRSGVALIL